MICVVIVCTDGRQSLKRFRRHQQGNATVSARDRWRFVREVISGTTIVQSPIQTETTVKRCFARIRDEQLEFESPHSAGSKQGYRRSL
ncbi:hypothetical protein EA462_09880 [Natrarchaeobius halalkaliphilus]|uniref:Uncharacterized protein n=1 Tax=Natrarchaeobius halalkaliphilus TaxID=1679091 RepID=A0A3N6LMK8_9EURY|nr:hypothetical protein EA462_09880 [Natrarchaeobius halalkaliphilus]